MLKKALFLLIAFSILLWAGTYLALRFESHEYAQLSPAKELEATSYLEGKLAPIPQHWKWQNFEPEQSIILRTGIIDTPNAKGLVIVLPGFTDTIEMMMYEIARISEAGYRVAAIEYRGQGKSWHPLPNPEKGYVESYAVLANDIAKFAQGVRQQNEDLFFYSISKGAHITMRMAAEHKIGVNAYALITPMIKINTGELDYELVRTLSALSQSIGLGSMYAPGQSAWPTKEDLAFGTATACNGNPQTAQKQSAMFAQYPSLRTRGATMKWLAQTIKSTDMLMDKKHQSAITEPVKLITAGIDHLVSTDAATAFCNSLSQCDVVHYADSKHCIASENAVVYDEIIDVALAHFDQHSTKGTPPSLSSEDVSDNL